MKKMLLTIIGISLLTYMGLAQNNNNSIDDEIEKWTKELYNNGEVGPPCKDDWNEWAEENPDYYWGLQEIQEARYDFNKDGIKDVLAFFPARNCLAGSGIDSDFAILIYSYNGNFLTNNKITDQIEKKITDYLYENRIYRVLIKYDGLRNTIKGKFYAWLGGDANCCPSYEGTFDYNPISFEFSAKYKLKE